MQSYLWKPSDERRADSLLARFSAEYWPGHKKHFAENSGESLDGFDTLYDSLWLWSVSERAEFWRAVWQFCGVVGQSATKDLQAVLENESDIKNARFFPQAKLNYAETLLAEHGAAPAIITYTEDDTRTRWSWDDLRGRVSVLQQALTNAGVKKGDRVGAILPNNAEAITAMLATASLGAVWSSCSPDFGAQGLLDRFGQIEPTALFACAGYAYNGKDFSITERLEFLAQKIPSIKKIIISPYKDNTEDLSKLGKHATHLTQFIAPYTPREPTFTPCDFNAPLFILYSSGTTGLPKCIVHSHGGTLLQHLKEHQLQCDMKAGDRLAYFTTCGWMMWNWMASALASKVCLVLYDGAAFFPDGGRLARLAEAEQITHLGVSAKYLDASAKQGVSPIGEGLDLTALRVMLSTGSPLAANSFDYVYQQWKADICLSSIAGGTDIMGCFVGGSPLDAVYAGVCQKRHLGMEVAVFDEDGNVLTEAAGELVCLGPHPSQPIGFWRDETGAKYHAAYYARFENVWHHGDWVALHESGGMVFYGRSDAVLNPGGVRIGTAEIYRTVEAMTQIEEALVIGQDWHGDVRVVLFVRLAGGAVLDETLAQEIRARLRREASPRHIPAKIIAVADIPRTKSGKITELAVRDIVAGRPLRNVETLANPEALELFRDLAELQD